MMILNVKHILLPSVNCLSILLFANLISIGHIFSNQTISLNTSRIRIKHFWIHYVLIVLSAIISALIFAVLPDSKTLSYLLICWSILFLIAIFYNLKAFLLLLEITFGNDDTSKK